MRPIVKVENLSKQYRLGAQVESYSTLRDVLAGAARAPLGFLRRNGRGRGATFQALQEVSFNVMPGEVVGIIGRNGAGKSTLLKILSRITEPTAGRVELYGRVASLLEVGTGFHPELTGRENIYLNGAILGMKKAEIERKFDEIVAFAEIEKFIDTPVKHYSSGMYVRLAFAVAAHLEPEILIIDEVLAVGDAMFQKKCLGKMSDAAREGRTVLFVSHNMVAVQNLCGRALWLHGGKIVEEADPSTVIAKYHKAATSVLTEQVWHDVSSAPGNDKVRVRRVCVRPVDGSASDPVTIKTPFIMEFEYWNLEPDACLNPSLHIYNEQGLMVFNTAPVHEPVWHGRPFPAGLFRSLCYVPGDLLNDGTYRVELLVVKDQGVIIYAQDDALVFDVRDAVEMRGAWHGKWAGVVRPNLKWDTEHLVSRA